MTRNKSIFAVFISLFFLTMIVAQSVHQIGHLSHYIENQTNQTDHNHCKHHGHISENQTCELCDFTFSPSLQFERATFEIEIITKYEYEIVNWEPTSFVPQTVNSYKQLRAPPVNT